MKIQRDSYSCGVIATVNALRCLGKKIPEKLIRNHSATSEKHGTQEHGIKQSLERLGFNWKELAIGNEGEAWSTLTESVADGSPVVLDVDRSDRHWVVAIGTCGDRIVIFDSDKTKKNKEENGVHVYTKKQLFRRWKKFENKHYYGIIINK